MKLNFIKVLGVTTMLLTLVACDGLGTGDKPFQPQDYNVSGKVEKGPFVSGSNITMQLLDNKMQTIGEMYTTTILDDVGSFTFGSKKLTSPYADLTANGYFFNEVKGRLSDGTLNLRAVVDVSDATTINVNILTHIKYQRVLNLVASGKSFKEANAQAQRELFEAFGCPQFADVDVSHFSIIGGDDKAGVLIAISSLLLVERSEAEVTEYLAKLCREFAGEGKFSSATQEIIRMDLGILSGYLDGIGNNIINRYAELGMTVDVPDLRKYFDWDGDGIPGNEENVNTEVVVPEENLIKNLYSESEVNTNGLPLLGVDGERVVANMMLHFAEALSKYNLIQQYYHYNPEVGNLVSQYIYPSSSTIGNIWTSIYKSHNTAMLLQYADMQKKCLYQEYCNFFTAIQYYYMTAMWGDMPYITDYEWYIGGQREIARTDMHLILEEQARLLREAMEGTYEDKRSESHNINDIFFVSKDVARVLLAEIYLTLGEYHIAKDMLYEVINSGYYELTDANFSNPDILGDNVFSDTGDANDDFKKELLFALYVNSDTRGDITIRIPSLIPMQTLTEVMLLHAEACYLLGDWAKAHESLQTLAAVKGITLDTEDVLQAITYARKELLLYSVGNFAYMKRHHLMMQEYGVGEPYMLLPIPQQEMDTNPLMIQNPGY